MAYGPRLAPGERPPPRGHWRLPAAEALKLRANTLAPFIRGARSVEPGISRGITSGVRARASRRSGMT